MEQAVNTFTGGLNLDSHPMVQGTDTLSDALNATYVTMNGNEVVLQNDMGNRRVDNAYLPAGYEPVGIKEYGGIIYVAAYNPITHRSQIGSFPSPERIMGEEYTDNGAEFSLLKFTSSDNYIIKNGIKFLKDDVILIPLTNDTSLHAGDKFTVYSDDVWSWGNSGLLTNFGTQDGNGNHKYSNTPFNSHFTLSLGILNSSNEFSDITHTLERFDINGNIIKDFNSDEEKFNIGYFIAPKTRWEDRNEEISDRNKKGANTYAYKLTGPLYLKAELNHIQTFSYTIEASKTEENNTNIIDLYITGTATYNCPDNRSYFDCFDLYLNGNQGYELKAPEQPYTNINRIYDSTTGNYISTVEKHYSNIQTSLNTLDYLIAVPIFNSNPSGFSDGRNIFISELSEFGTLEVNKMGTNECDLTMWKYKNIVSNGEVTSTLLDFKFNCYKDKNHKFENLSIILEDLTVNSENNNINLNQIVDIDTDIDSGRKQFLITWENSSKKLLSQHLYKAIITYQSRDISNETISTQTIYRFILGTELFNKCYNEINTEDYVPDYGIFMGEISGDYYVYNNNIILPVSSAANELRETYLVLNDKIDIVSNPILTDSTVEQNSYGLSSIYTSQPPVSVNYSYKQFQKTIDVEYKTEWELNNRELYPANLELINTSTSVAIQEISKNIDKNLIYSPEFVQQAQNFEGSTPAEKIVVLPNSNEITTNGNHFIFNVLLRDKIYFNHQQQTKVVGKAYVNVDSSTYRNYIIDLLSRDQEYNGFGFWNPSGETDLSYGGVFLKKSSLTQTSVNNRNAYGYQNYWGTVLLDLWKAQSYLNGGDAEMSTLYNDYFLPQLQKMKCPFTFILFDFSDSNNANSDNFIDTSALGYRNGWTTVDYSGLPADEFCRVWWVNEDNSPILLNNKEDQTPGVFSGGSSSYNDSTKLQNIYNGILSFIGYTYDENNPQHLLVMPLENIPFNAWYPNDFLYSDNTEATIKVDLNFTLSTQQNQNNSISVPNSCIAFKTVNFSETKQKTISKKYTINNNYSQEIFNLSQQTDLSNFSIDLETAKIISQNDPLKHLYIRKNDNWFTLKLVPYNYPIQINTGNKYEFPLTCTKIYDVNGRTDIGHSYQYFWKIDDRIKIGGNTDPTNKKIPVLYQADLTVNSNFFD